MLLPYFSQFLIKTNSLPFQVPADPGGVAFVDPNLPPDDINFDYNDDDFFIGNEGSIVDVQMDQVINDAHPNDVQMDLLTNDGLSNDLNDVQSNDLNGVNSNDFNDVNSNDLDVTNGGNVLEEEEDKREAGRRRKDRLAELVSSHPIYCLIVWEGLCSGKKHGLDFLSMTLNNFFRYFSGR